MPLHPDAQRIIDNVPPAADGPPPDVATMRAEFAKAWSAPADLPPVASVRDTAFAGPGGEVPVRVYTPEGEGPFPAFLWFHGGGWTIGSVEENDFACRTVCREAEAVVISVAYRLAPEDPFPAAAEDCYAALLWAHGSAAALGVDPVRLAAGGESAGGNLAAVVALLTRDRGGPRLARQVLVSPVLGHPDDGRASYRQFADGYFLSKASMDWFFTTYPRNAKDLENPYLLPLRATDLSGLAPALILGAEYDVLRDEGEDYAAALAAAGVEVELVRLDGLIHGFFGLLATELGGAREAHTRTVASLRAAFGTA
ncbi:alpha/beta hydrolase [Nonomuraea sp. NPDC050310]|uniref:alpha/beta hydrolase n=1 Tax=Nonomuraea sp. NPDC050310 TaxID=3154935 RepID=UPI0033E5B546